MSDIPKIFTADYYDQEYFRGEQGGKTFFSGDELKKWSYYNKTGDNPACKVIAEAWKTMFNPENMLDMGAGRGTQIAYCRDLGIEAVGFDWSEYATSDKGRYERCKKEWLINHDGRKKLPYEDNAFDLVIGLDYYEHHYLDDLPLVIDETYRVANKWVFLQIAVAGSGGLQGRTETGYVLEKDVSPIKSLEGCAVAGHVTVRSEQWWTEICERCDWIQRRDLKQWFISLVPETAIRNWLLNSILVYEK